MKQLHQQRTPPALLDEGHDSDAPFAAPVVVPLSDVIDLHAFQPPEVHSVAEEYPQACCAAGFSTVRLIQGKGKGVQRESIRALLARLP